MRSSDPVCTGGATFFVQNNHVQRLTAPVAMFARTNGLALEDRSSFEGFDPDNCGIDWSEHSTVPYGSVQFLRQCKNSSLGRFVLHDEEAFAASNWMPILGDLSLNHAGHRADVREITHLLSPGGRLHVRPDRVDKAFAGAVFDASSWQQAVQSRRLAGELDCWVTPVRHIEAEWRCWIVGGEVVNVSQYRDSERMCVREENDVGVWRAASELSGVFTPAPCVVMDIAKTDTGHAVIEYNPIHCSGWYAARVDRVLSDWVQWSTHHFSKKQALAKSAG
jgi:hypothetical protein